LVEDQLVLVVGLAEEFGGERVRSCI
jgi:hypothetical protein